MAEFGYLQRALIMAKDNISKYEKVALAKLSKLGRNDISKIASIVDSTVLSDSLLLLDEAEDREKMEIERGLGVLSEDDLMEAVYRAYSDVRSCYARASESIDSFVRVQLAKQHPFWRALMTMPPNARFATIAVPWHVAKERKVAGYAVVCERYLELLDVAVGAM